MFIHDHSGAEPERACRWRDEAMGNAVPVSVRVSVEQLTGGCTLKDALLCERVEDPNVTGDNVCKPLQVPTK
jgi:hypothetical protein